MKRGWKAGAGLAAVLAVLPVAADASGDYGCYPHWSLDLADYECAGTALIGPRNDSRVNLVWLMQDKRSPGASARYPERDWETAEYGHVFLSWESMQQAYWPRPAEEAEWSDAAYAGSLCQTYQSGAEDFRSALAASRGLKDAERSALSGARDLLKATCDGAKAEPAWPDGIASASGRDFLSYLKGAQAFYAEDFARAAPVFAALSHSKEPWVAEASRYMTARNALAAAQAGGLDEWGWYDNAKADKAAAGRGEAALGDYLKAYPSGRYAGSAEGLFRRAAWLKGERPAQARIYGGLLSKEVPMGADTPALLEEIDAKLFFATGASGSPDAPLLLATWDLVRMRQAEPMMAEYRPSPLGAEELEGQASVFAQHPDLFGYLKAVHAFYVAKDYARVLKLLPDDARQARYTPLAFSRQLLRGLALEAKGDPNAAGFWKELLGGAKGLYQRPTVELALAMNRERHGALAEVFAKGSPITEPEIRVILLEHVAGADLLRAQARAGLGRLERDAALFTLLYKELSRARYAEFGRDFALVGKDARKEGWIGGWAGQEDGNVPLGLFTRGQWQEGYACPALVQTATTLAATPQAVKAQLCLAEFYRLNGFDAYLADEGQRDSTQLGGTPAQFSGKARTRGDLYASVLAQGGAAPEDTAYALYRSVMCYAPSGNNSCGKGEVPEAQRKAWFQRLKREFPKSPWATKLKYYW